MSDRAYLFAITALLIVIIFSAIGLGATLAG